MPTWTSAIAVGHPTIDQQHKELFARADQLLEAMHQGRASAELAELFQFLGGYVREHFGTEERLMAAKVYPAMAGHKAQHGEFVRRLEEDLVAFRAKGATAAVVLDLSSLIRGWLVNHISTVDVKLADFLKAREPVAGARSP
ncbi:MAG TPA: hemerythrin family protein [Anaeromyxobacter sp.]|nr:hemerythrin family protein [Anaeromyxobacter sp.]